MSQERIITPEATIMWPNLFEPREDKQGNLKYSACFVFGPNTDTSGLRKAADAALKERFGPQAGKMVKAGSLNHPLRSGAERLDKGWPEDVTFFNARTKFTPGVVSQVPDADGNPSVIEDPELVRPGTVVKASVNVYTYDVNGNRGAGFGLGNVQVLRQGEPIVESVSSAVAEFTADPNAVAEIDDLKDLGA